MSARLNRALQVRTADRLRASLARDEFSGLPLIGALVEADLCELCQVGGGRLGAVLIRVNWTIDTLASPGAKHEVRGRVMRAVAQIIDTQVRRTDLLGSPGADVLLILAPGLDRLSAQSLAQRLRALFVERQLELDDVQVQPRINVGLASRSATSLAGWTIRTLIDEAERDAAHPPPVAIVA